MSFFHTTPFLSIEDVFNLPFLIDQDSPRTAAQNGGDAQGGGQLDRQNQNRVFHAFKPSMDVHENAVANTVTASFELPGMKKEDVTIDVRNNRLFVSGETKSEKEVKEEGYVHRERRVGKFSRTLPLPSGTQPNDIKASMTDGVLKVTFPKTTQEQAAQRITID